MPRRANRTRRRQRRQRALETPSRSRVIPRPTKRPLHRTHRRRPASPPADPLRKSERALRKTGADADLQVERLEVSPEWFGQVGPAKREIDESLQKSELVAGVVSNAADLTGVNR